VSDAILDSAARLRREGKLSEAAALYGELLRVNPAHFEALQALGIMAYQAGQIENAERLLGNAASLRPGTADLAYNHACLLQKLNRLEDALAAFDRALAIKPAYFQALVNRGAVLNALNRHEEALANADRVVSLEPNFAEGWTNRAAILNLLGRTTDALADCAHAGSLNPRHVLAWKLRGTLLQKLGRPDEAVPFLEKACELAPSDAEVQGRRADVLVLLNRYREAAEAYEKFVALAPNDAAGWHARGFVLQILHRRAEALDCFDHALKLDATNDAIRTVRANILFELERWEEAAREYEVLLAANTPPAWLHGYLAICRLHVCDWRRLDAQKQSISAALKRGEFVIDPIGNACISDSLEEQRQCAKIWARDRCPPAPPLWTGERYRHRRIRIAYLSADFRAHATAFLMAGVFEHHDRSQFEVTAISWSADDRSEIRARLMNAFDTFVEAGDLTDADIAKKVRELEIDIAIDLKGYTNESRPAILANRPAPVQAQYLAYPGTMAVDFMDYLIADRITLPESLSNYYSEKIAWLPGSYQCNDDRPAPVERGPTRYETRLPPGFVFCCFNSNHKIAPESFAIWMRLLNNVSGSVLWLLEDNPAATRNLRASAQAHGVAPDRLIFAPRTDPASHLARQRNADLFLDTLPYNAHTTASDALWAGLPVLTMRGSTFAGRVGASVLTAAGLPELVTNSPEEYENLALQLATEPARLAAIKRKLADNRTTCALFDTRRFTRNLETAYRIMQERSQSGLTPQNFAVPET
jgi:protein O-GlcNAc transferase